MATIVEEVKVKVIMRDGETDHNHPDVVSMIRKMIEYAIHQDCILGDSFEEDVLDDLIRVEVE